MQPDSVLHDSLKKELNRKQREKIHNVIDKTIANYKISQYYLVSFMMISGDEVIAQKLASLEHYRLDKPKPVDRDASISIDMDSGVTENSTESKK